MRLDNTIFVASLLGLVAAAALDAPLQHDEASLEPLPDVNQLFKRRGGGGGGAKGGGGGGGGGSKGGGSSGGGGSKGGAGSGPRGNTQPSSNSGGTSRGGSGPSRGFDGGRSYAGGSATPFRSGGVSPLGIVPFALVGASLAFWPGVWLAGAHLYPYGQGHRFHNATTDQDETINVLCGCADSAVCGCDDNNSTAYYNELLGNGSYEALNKSVVDVGEFRGSKTLLINGTLPNGTTADGPDEDSSAGYGRRDLLIQLGFWPIVGVVLAAVFTA